MMRGKRPLARVLVYLAVVTAMCIAALPSTTAAAPVEQGRSRTFPETNQTVSGRFLEVWEGGRSFEDSLFLNGLPLTDRHDELSLEDGKVYKMQWFERARFEEHPENRAPYDVLLGRLGAYAAEGRTDQPFRGIDNPGPNSNYVPETRHTVGDSSAGGRAIFTFWQRMGGVAQFGYPLSQPFQEVTREVDPAVAGKSFLVQYFERQRFEYHPENAGTRFEVLLGRLGAEQMGQAGVSIAKVPDPSGNSIEVLRFGLSQEPDSLYSLTSTQLTSFIVLGAIERFPIARDETGALWPELAAFVPTIANGGAYYIGSGADQRFVVKFKLRHGVKWSDGQPVTSNDIVYGFKLALDPLTQIADRSLWQKVAELNNPDAHTLIYNFLTSKEAAELYRRDPETYSPLAPFVQETKPVVDPNYVLVANTNYPEHVMGQRSASEMEGTFGRNPVGTGPYKLARWEPGQFIELTRNEFFDDWNPNAPHLPRVRFNIVTDSNALLTQIQSGSIDAAAQDALTLDQAPTLDRLQGKKVEYTPALTWEHLNFNTQKPTLSDVRVRRAIAHALNRQAVIDSLLFGKTRVSNTWMPPGFAWSLENQRFAQGPVGSKYKLEQYAYNPARARQLLDEAGWRPGADGIRVKDGRRLSLEWYTTIAQVRQNTTLAFQQDLLQVGIELKPNFVRAASDLFGSAGVTSTGAYDVAEFASTYPADPGGFGSYHTSGIPTEETAYSGQNYPRWSNKRNDELITIATNTVDEAERAAAYAEQQHLTNQELPRLGLYVRPAIHVAPANMQNFKPTGSTTPITWNIENWFSAR